MTKQQLKREHSIDVVNNASTSPDDVKLKSELDPLPHFQNKLPWCSIYYYELDQRYGDPFHGELLPSENKIITTDRPLANRKNRRVDEPLRWNQVLSRHHNEYFPEPGN